MQKAKLIVITGPTGVGKSDVALHLAEDLNQPLIYFEPVLAYQELNIGSAKPSRKDRERIKHEGIDLTDLDHPMTLVDLYHAILPKVVAQLAQNHLAIVVTGSGFFLKALLHGVPQFHEHEAGHIYKETIFKDITGKDTPEKGEAIELPLRLQCYEVLKEKWPKRAVLIHPNDIYRILRSLEVAINLFEKYPDLKLSGQIESAGITSLLPPTVETHLFALSVDSPRYEENLRDRVSQMLEAGWIEEVQSLISQKRPLIGALKSVGYREIYEFLQINPSGFEDDAQKQAFIDVLSRAHRQLFRKQVRWFKQFPSLLWLNNTERDTITLVHDIVDKSRAVKK
jgi:tRNA dimethylallyltransferase